MSIKYKILLPILPLVLFVGCFGYFLLTGKFDTLRYSFAEMVVGNTARTLALNTENAALRAQEEAALFSRMPAVVEAFRLAHGGNLDDERDPAAQQARETLRESLKPALSGYRESFGEQLQLHFHLPNGRSLVRLWRDKQAKRGGSWVDISDDISSFRQTVLDVNRDGKARRGIEPGRGGFAIRGLVAVRDAGGARLGSVEVLKNYGDVFKFFEKDMGKFFTLYMDASLLSTTTKLQDPKEYPVLDNAFVRVAGKANSAIDDSVTPAELRKAMREQVFTISGDYALAYIPVKDYQGRPIGVIALAQDISSQNAILDNAIMVVLAIFLCAVLIPILSVLGVLPFAVFRPLTKIRRFAEDVARGNLSSSVELKGNDEICRIHESVKQIPASISALISDCEETAEQVRKGVMNARGDAARYEGAYAELVGSVNALADTFTSIFDTLPFPMFTIDRDCNLQYVNRQTELCAGRQGSALLGSKCHDAFSTSDCRTSNCICDKAMRTVENQSGATQATTSDGVLEVKNYAIPLKDAKGGVSGAMEIVVDQTDVIESHRKMRRVANEAEQLSQRMTAAAEQLSAQVEGSRDGAEEQTRRTVETATAMEQMNSTVLEVAQNATHAAENTELTRKQAQEGSDIVVQVVSSVNDVQQLASLLKENMGELGRQADGIGRVMTVITDIADQTNLLALNAAIEAARAGDAGRGFAVVADEVRKLAEKTMLATKEVGESINAIQSVTQRNIAETDKVAGVVGNCTRLAETAGHSLVEIVDLSRNSADQVRGIATAAEEQSAASEQITRSTEEIHKISEDTRDAMSQAVQACSELSHIAHELNTLISDLSSE
ncbi:methyl-accepting chemotaxis protein [Salidesulfovibrio onnuriiensis]|uniref:methyl-accepting chemotaxis protein n=1 Tax=Salidesulfovibrio onnuriiensis TaxID=2583823 RepID=UPI0011CAD4A3|nr:methyl-accepting chemotaxis protein [Salidesulfovibrio onnuriiensis]